LARLDESIAAFNQRFIFPLPFAMEIIKINLWNQGSPTGMDDKIMTDCMHFGMHGLQSCRPGPIPVYLKVVISRTVIT
jgi:hypothetical protein